MGKSVLIVDDHPSFRASARRMLEAHGYEVRRGGRGRGRCSARRWTASPGDRPPRRPLPDLNGFEVAKSLLGHAGPVPLVVLTSSHDYADLARPSGTLGCAVSSLRKS